MTATDREPACATATPTHTRQGQGHGRGHPRWERQDARLGPHASDARPAAAPGDADTPPAAPFVRGWAMLGACTLVLMATAPGQTFGISVFNDEFRTSLGLSHSQLTGAYMLGTLLAALPLTYIGALMDRLGPRRVLTGVIILFGGACMLTSAAGGLVMLFLGFLTLRMFGQGAMGMLSGSTISLWFNRRLGFVNGIRHVGMACAIATIPALNLWLIESFGWRSAYMVLGIGVWVLLLPLMLLVFRNRPEDVGQVPDGLAWNHREAALRPRQAPVERDFTLREAMRCRAYWLLIVSMSLWSMFGTAVLFNIVPIVQSLGLDRVHAATMYTTFALTLAVMHIIAGLLADRLPLNVLLSLAVLMLSLAMGVIWQAATPGQVYLFGILLGVAQGVMIAVGPPLLVRYFGRAHIGSIQGSTATVLVAASSAGPFLLGASYDLLGGYDLMLMLFFLIPLPVALAALLATRPAYPPPGRVGEGNEGDDDADLRGPDAVDG